MRRIAKALTAAALLAIGVTGGETGLALAGGTHAGGHGTTGAEAGHGEGAEAMHGMGMMPGSVEEMREMHREHEHGHDFAVMEELSPDQLARMMGLMHDVGVVMPPMDPVRGRHLFVEKGCIACHSVNGVGGDLGPALNAGDMPRPMNSFEFVARMWRGARAMTEMQEDLFGEVISLDGQDLADLVVFAHDAEEQARLTEDQIPERFHSLIHGE
jgi:hypothetical protein